MKRQRGLWARPGFLALLLAFGFFLFYWPFLFHNQEWRQPHTAIYFFLAWALVIFLVFLVSRTLQPREGREADSVPRRGAGEP